MGDSEPELFPPWKQLEKIASGWEYESKHPHDEILKILGLKSKNTSYYQQVDKANHELTQIGKLLENLRDFGYVVVRPDEYAGVSMKYKKRAFRRLERAVDIIKGTPVHLLTPPERSRIEQMLQGTLGLYQMADKDRKKSMKIVNAKPSDPRFAPKNDRKMITYENT